MNLSFFNSSQAHYDDEEGLDYQTERTNLESQTINHQVGVEVDRDVEGTPNL